MIIKNTSGTIERQNSLLTEAQPAPAPIITTEMMQRSDKPLLIVQYGVGIDSTALLIQCRRLGIIPDLILFSDLKSEKRKTYQFLPVMQRWLKQSGFPPVTVIRAPRQRDSGIEAMCLRLGTLPSLAFGAGHHNCSNIWKVEASDRFLQTWEPYQYAARRGEKIVRAVGFSVDETHRVKRAAKNAAKEKNKKGDAGADNCRSTGFTLSDTAVSSVWFPLITWQMTRSDCIDLILDEGLPLMPKSACFFCPASKPEEIRELETNEPHLFFRACVMERLAQNNRIVVHGRIQGLNFGKPWLDLEIAEKYRAAVDRAIRIFRLDRTLADGLRKGDGWMPKARRVELFIAAFASRSQLEYFMQNDQVPDEFPPRENESASQTENPQMCLTLNY